MNIDTNLIKTLRQRTGAGLMECKKILLEAKGDIEEAVKLLRIIGLTKAEKKAHRQSSEGAIIIAAHPDHSAAAIVEINCETDFVARDHFFVDFADQTAQLALSHQCHSVEELLKQQHSDYASIEEARQNMVQRLGENIQVRRVSYLAATKDSKIAYYRHAHQIGVLVHYQHLPHEVVEEIAVHIAANHPIVIDQKDMPADIIQDEREILHRQAQESGKPAEIIDKMVHGRLQQFIAERALYTQPFLLDSKKTIGSLVKLHHGSILQFIRFQLGEDLA